MRPWIRGEANRGGNCARPTEVAIAEFEEQISLVLLCRTARGRYSPVHGRFPPWMKGVSRFACCDHALDYNKEKGEISGGLVPPAFFLAANLPYLKHKLAARVIA